MTLINPILSVSLARTCLRHRGCSGGINQGQRTDVEWLELHKADTPAV